MPNYKESKMPAQSWTRCNKVICENPHEGQKAITFVEEEVFSVKGRSITSDCGAVAEVFTQDNAGEEFSILHPDTGALLGKSTYAQTYAMLHSMYLHMAAKRDIAAAQSTEE